MYPTQMIFLNRMLGPPGPSILISFNSQILFGKCSTFQAKSKMPQLYKKKTDRVVIPAAEMTGAVTKVVNENKSLRTVAKDNNLPRTALLLL